MDITTKERKDILICGGTGFTALKLLELVLSKRARMKVGITCRNKNKQEELLKTLEERTGLSTESVEVHVIDLSNLAQVVPVLQKYKVAVNCIGPFAYTGTQVIQAAIQAKTHYVDCTGEPGFMDKSFSLFQEKAKGEGVIVVHACGFDSVPIDIGMMYTMKVLEEEGKTASTNMQADSYLMLNNSRINIGTFKTIIASLDTLKARPKNKKPGIEESKKKPGTKGPRVRKIPFYSKYAKMYSVLFPGADSYVLRKTRALLGETYPLCHCYFAVPTVFRVFLLFLLLVLIFLVYLLPEAGRSVAYKYIDFLTLGAVRRDGPSEEEIAASGFQIKIFVKGNTAEGEKLCCATMVSGPDPGYVATPAILLVSAELIMDNLPSMFKEKGGVYTPGALFHGTDIIARLQKEKIMFCKLPN
ncbi:hypothetical protein NECID01_1076 [Nematocida sp. AWRm77]|nr:hypothetical protein NECID01_1076 [Nematocida sp. AWRm77]